MFKKLCTYIIIGVLLLGTGSSFVYAQDSTEFLSPSNIFDKITKRDKDSEVDTMQEDEVSSKLEDVSQGADESGKNVAEVENSQVESESGDAIAKESEDMDEVVKKDDEAISIFKYYENKKSLMYKDENLFRIIKVLSSLERGEILDDVADDKVDVNSKESLEDVPVDAIISVYLNSILYISDDSWAVWANGEKITTYDEPNKEIRVLSVSPDRVDFLWTISKIKWDIINSNNIISEDVYTVEGEHVNMMFTLEPNQSFVPSMNKIIEGSLEYKNGNGDTDGNGATTNGNERDADKPQDGGGSNLFI